nr:hypothetical protein GCM10017745_31390 [Saccharothrix mutabilis subsp. capreolus]
MVVTVKLSVGYADAAHTGTAVTRWPPTDAPAGTVAVPEPAPRPVWRPEPTTCLPSHMMRTV